MADRHSVDATLRNKTSYKVSTWCGREAEGQLWKINKDIINIIQLLSIFLVAQLLPVSIVT